MAKTTKTRESFDKELFKRSVLYNIKTLYRRTLEEATPQQIYQAASLAINPNTIQRAYRELEAEGCICSVPGRGSFVCKTDAAMLARRAALSAQLQQTAGELRALGMRTEEILSLIKEGNDDD